ncbi:MAG: GDP-mannose 4,6-dehydratase [Patescibacteria group bacterium]|nr:GDP-mannose 4,6-dehydratase [Patescibacteria group bacterium]
MKKAFITGITGQDGSYLADLLIQKGYEVHGLVRRSSTNVIGSHEGVMAQEPDGSKNIHLYYGDLSDFGSIANIIRKVQPDEVYNLAAMSDVRVSFDVPEYTADVSGVGALRVFEAVRQNGKKGTKIYQASTSEMYGEVVETPQSETTPFNPRSPYAVSKVFAHWLGKNYRDAYGMFVASGILFNHESPRRGPNFLTRKITRGVANIMLGRQRTIYLGNLDAKRDWGYAPEYVEAMWRMLQQEQPDDFVIATGETHTVREFLEEAFALAGKRWEDHVEIKKELFRPSEVDLLIGNPSKAKRVLGWEAKVKLKELVKILLDADLAEAKRHTPVS